MPDEGHVEEIPRDDPGPRALVPAQQETLVRHAVVVVIAAIARLLPGGEESIEDAPHGPIVSAAARADGEVVVGNALLGDAHAGLVRDRETGSGRGLEIAADQGEDGVVR